MVHPEAERSLRLSAAAWASTILQRLAKRQHRTYSCATHRSDHRMTHLTRVELEAGLDAIYQSPRDAGPLELIVRRPAVGERELLEQAELDRVQGMVGDTWIHRRSKMTRDGAPHP